MQRKYIQIMDVGKLVRSSMNNAKIDVSSMSSAPQDRAKLLATTSSAKVLQQQQQQQRDEQHKHPKDRTMKLFNKVQVVYYLTRNGQLEHPHYIEVSHMVTQPLRLKDVIDRLTVLRGKAMPRQYSWSCKRSYKNGYVWNDLSENDVIYASEGSEYVLKGSELLLERDFSETKLGDLHMKKRQQRKDQRLRANGLMSKSNGTHQGHNYKQEATKSYEQNLNNEEDEEEEEEKASCDSSNAPCTTMQMEQEESYSLPSTCSTNSDKQPPQTPPTSQTFPPLEAPKTSTSESKTLEKDAARVIEEDGDPAISTTLTRNNTILLHLIACGGGGMFAPKGENKPTLNGGSRKNSNFSMKNSFMPCLNQQLSNRTMSTKNNNAVNLRIKGIGDQRKLSYKAGDDGNQGQLVTSNEDEDEDMMMVRYISENPRFGNLQSEEKEYFSGTILETMTQAHHQHTQSTGSASSCPHSQFPVLTKSSSYNEQRCSKGELQAAGVASSVDEDEEKDDKKFTGIIKLCIPRKKSFSSCSTKHC